MSKWRGPVVKSSIYNFLGFGYIYNFCVIASSFFCLGATSDSFLELELEITHMEVLGGLVMSGIKPRACACNACAPAYWVISPPPELIKFESLRVHQNVSESASDSENKSRRGAPKGRAEQHTSIIRHGIYPIHLDRSCQEDWYTSWCSHLTSSCAWYI